MDGSEPSHGPEPIGGKARGIVQALLITRHMLFIGFDESSKVAHFMGTPIRSPPTSLAVTLPGYHGQ
jgi:hypothetical protein